MNRVHYLGFSLLAFVLMAGIFAGSGLSERALGAASSTVNLPSTVTVGNAAPSMGTVYLNGGSTIILTPDATTSILVAFTAQDANGCGDIFFSGNVTTTVYRTGVSSTCSASNLNCYIVSGVTTNNCPSATSSNTSANATATVNIYYFAQGTDASSSFNSDTWTARVVVGDATGASSSASSTSVELNSVIALNITTSSIDYGTMAANSDTGSTMRYATTTNAGNTTTTLRIYALSTLASGGNIMATSSQHYSSSSFSMPSGGIALSDTITTLTGFVLTSPTTTTNVAKATMWGLAVPGGTATGTYNGTNVFSSLWQP